MVDITKSDRIVISSNSKMEMVIRWYMDNQELISEKGFVAPLKKGFVVLKEEGLGFSFEHKGNITTITICEKGYTLRDLNNKYGLAEILKNWERYKQIESES